MRLMLSVKTKSQKNCESCQTAKQPILLLYHCPDSNLKEKVHSCNHQNRRCKQQQKPLKSFVATGCANIHITHTCPDCTCPQTEQKGFPVARMCEQHRNSCSKCKMCFSCQNMCPFQKNRKNPICLTIGAYGVNYIFMLIVFQTLAEYPAKYH